MKKKPNSSYIDWILYWVSLPQSDLYRHELLAKLREWQVDEERINHALKLRESREIVRSVNIFDYNNARDYLDAVVQRAKDLGRFDLLVFLEKPKDT